ncbi:MAG: CopG family antitoxin [Desulfococcaceae bacterium]
MKKDKSSVSDADSCRKIGEFRDTHDLAEYRDQTEEAEFDVDIQSEKKYFPIELTLAGKIKELAMQKGVSSETLLNLWVRDMIAASR